MLLHEPVSVLVLPLTTTEAERLIAGERRTYRKLDTADRETVRSSVILCAHCKVPLTFVSDLLSECERDE